MKNNNVKEMIRQQKMMAEERKEMVSIRYDSNHFSIGTVREEIDAKK
jgi:acid stress-induced BolA-like protein IbaG/YrbA